MDVNAMFPSTYLKAADLQGRNITVTVDHVVMETLGQGEKAEQKPIIYFQGKERGLVANKTNMRAIAAVYGNETDEWVGAEVVLFEAMVSDPQGKIVPAIRVKIPPRKPTRVAEPPRPEPSPPQQHGALSMAAIIDEDIPFMYEWR